MIVHEEPMLHPLGQCLLQLQLNIPHNILKNNGYVDKLSVRISQCFSSNLWLSRYPRPIEQVVYDNGSEFKKDFQPLIKDFIKPIHHH